MSEAKEETRPLVEKIKIAILEAGPGDKVLMYFDGRRARFEDAQEMAHYFSQELERKVVAVPETLRLEVVRAVAT